MEVEFINVAEIAFVDPGFMILDTAKHTIPVGTMAVIPHVPDDVRLAHSQLELQEDEISPYTLPEKTLLLAGQSLPRELYPELSPVYAETGGFNHFTLPYLVKKFIIGVDTEKGDLVWGDGVIYYETVPEIIVPKRDIRQR